jgi:hypothetical protein
MGGGISKTNPNKFNLPVDETNECKNIIHLYKILLVISCKYSDEVKTLVMKQLNDEMPLALNFVMSIVNYDDLYNTLTNKKYIISNISEWHNHNYKLSVYKNLLHNEKNIYLFPQCKCLLTNEQLHFYEYLSK